MPREIPVPYALAVARHPEAVAKAMENRKKSRSAQKNVPAEELLWYYSVAVTVAALDLKNLLKTFGEVMKPVVATTFEEWMETFRPKVVLCLTGKKGRSYYGAQVERPDPTAPLPPEVEDQYRHGWRPPPPPPTDVDSLVAQVAYDVAFSVPRGLHVITQKRE